MEDFKEEMMLNGLHKLQLAALLFTFNCSERLLKGQNAGSCVFYERPDENSCLACERAAHPREPQT